MRVDVPCFGQLRLRSIATGASLGFLLACGSSGESGLFSKSQGGAPGSGGSPGNAGAAALGGATSQGGSAGSVSSGGSVSANGGGSATGGAALGGAASGGSVTTGGVATGGAASGGAPAGGTKATGGAATTSGGQGGTSSGGAPSTGGAGTGDAGAGGTGGGCSASGVERCDGVDNDCNGTVDEKACPAKCTGFALDGHGYMVCDVALNANKASALCEEQGLRLAWIETADENAALLETISGLGSSGRGGGILEVSIGATDSEDEGAWHWRGGEDFWLGGGKGSAVGGAYVNWADGRPNNSTAEAQAGEDCAVLVIDQADDGEPGEWNDVECALTYGVLCEEP